MRNMCSTLVPHGRPWHIIKKREYQCSELYSSVVCDGVVDLRYNATFAAKKKTSTHFNRNARLARGEARRKLAGVSIAATPNDFKIIAGEWYTLDFRLANRPGTQHDALITYYDMFTHTRARRNHLMTAIDLVIITVEMPENGFLHRKFVKFLQRPNDNISECHTKCWIGKNSFMGTEQAIFWRGGCRSAVEAL